MLARPPGATVAVLLVACTALLLMPQCAVPAGHDTAPGTIRFNRDVRPILAARCYRCHGRDGHARKAALRLDRGDGPDGAYRVRHGRAAIRPGSPEDSALWYRVETDDASVRMPPREAHERPLDPAEKAILREWIEQGAVYEDHWAFVPPASSLPPGVPEDGAIDHFVRLRLLAHGVPPSPRADQRTLIRRLTFDLTGLPPTRDEIRTFLSDTAPGAYERLVDRLLASLHYGEHMARYWLDLVRFADTNGVHHDHYRDMTPYRDWVIRAFNANMPYDEFVTDQLAGDLRPEPTDDQRIASGFNRLHLIIDVGTALPEESLARNVVDRVTAFGTAFLGLTTGCAVCHDHKYDPLEQKDFYQLYAFFNNLDGAPETGLRGTDDFRRGLQPPYVEFPTADQQRVRAELGCELAVANDLVSELQRRQRNAKKAAAADAENDAENAAGGDAEHDAGGDTTKAASPEPLDDVPATQDDPRQECLADELAKAKKDAGRLRREWRRLLRAIPAAMVMKERAEVRPAHILVRGNYDHPGERVARDVPAFLPPMRHGDGTPTRMDLATWLFSPDHPLTARVAVNRFWQQFFGVGIVKTAEDFGTQGEWPSHPELLDWLAVSFTDSGWDVKALVKRIVMSETYRQSSEAPPGAFARDPENRLLARGSRFRMDAEMIRDAILATSGLLNRRMFGRSVKPPQPAGIWKAVTLPSSFPRTYVADKGDAIYRRSVYTFWKRGLPPPQMTIFDAPARESCTARRERTNTPLQALLLWNEPEYLKAAAHLARRVLAADAWSDAERVRLLYETITSQLPDADETAALLRAAGDFAEIYERKPELANRLCAGLPSDGAATAPRLAAWTMVTNTIYNLDVTKTHQ